MSAIQITYRKNPSYTPHSGAEVPRLFAELDLSRLGIWSRVENLGIFYRQLERPAGPVRVIYSTRIAGRSIEAGNLQRLEVYIDETIRALTRFERLPEYLFRLKDAAWPIYKTRDQFLTRYPGGPVFMAQDIASLRLWLADHFKAIGRIRNRREMDLLFLSSSDLQLYAPLCVLRTPDESVPDIPVFLQRGSRDFELVAPLKETALCVPFAAGGGVFTLYTQVGEHLAQQGALDSIFEMTVRKLTSLNWNALRSRLAHFEQSLSYAREYDGAWRRVHTPVYIKDQTLIAARTNRLGRVVLYLEKDLPALRWRVGLDLASYGAIEHPDRVQTELAPAPSMVPDTVQ